MAKFKGKGVVAAGLLAGAASLLSKKENRDKAMEFINEARNKATKIVNEQKQNLQGKVDATEEQPTSDVAGEVAQAAASHKDLKIEENRFMDEGGAQQVIDDYNEGQHK